MGNCLKRSSSFDDVSDISLLNDNEDILPPTAIPPPASESSESSSRRPTVRAPPPYQERPSPAPPALQSTTGVGRPAGSQLTTDEQIRLAKRIGLINHLPCGVYDGSKKARECVICMNEFIVGDVVRFLPCMHTYHKACIDDWLMRSFTCPSCMEPVDAALLMTYETN